MNFARGWGLPLLTVLIAAVAGGIFSRTLAPKAIAPVAPSRGTAAAGARESAPESPLPELSVYHLEGSWQDQAGQQVSLRSLRGRPQVVAMIYGGCKGACPRIINDIKAVEASVRKIHPEGVGYLLVTMDPEVDSTDRLQALATEYDLGTAWRLLRGAPEQVRELAAVLGVKYRKVSQTEFAHSNTVSVLDANGTVVFQKEELGVGVEASSKAVQDLLAMPSPCCAH